jgi:T-complex protein 1 subunit beta
MNKILQLVSSGDINVTDDGAAISKAIQLDNAAAKILVNISRVQDDKVGDGTTSVTVLAAELLREAEKLIGLKIHPQMIVEGYRIASAAALKASEEAVVDHGYVVALRTVVTFCLTTLGSRHPSRSDTATFQKDLMNIARTTLSSKVLVQDKDYFANLAVDAVLRLKVSAPFWVGVSHRFLLMLPQGSMDLDHIQIIKKVGGKLTDSYLDEGRCYSSFPNC